MAKFCTECGAPLNGGARFCGACGAPVGSTGEAAPAPAAPAPATPTPAPANQTEQFVARSSGHVSAQPARKAARAAARDQVSAQPARPSAPEPARKKSRLPLVVAAVAVVVVVAVVVGVAAPGGAPSVESPSPEASAPADSVVTGEAEITFTQLDEAEALIESAAAVSTQLYVEARLATDALESAVEQGADYATYRQLLAEAQGAWDLAAEAVDGTQRLIDDQEALEAATGISPAQPSATFSATTASLPASGRVPFVQPAWADAPMSGMTMDEWAAKVADDYSRQPAGQKVKGLAALYGTDIETVRALLNQLAAYEAGGEARVEEEECTRCLNVLRTYKTTANVVVTTGAVVLCPPAGAVGWGTTIVSGASMLVDVAETGCTITLGENDSVTKAVHSANENYVAPVAGVVGILNFKNLTPENMKALFDLENSAATAKGVKALWVGGNNLLSAAHSNSLFGGTVKWDGNSVTIAGQTFPFGSDLTSDQAEEIQKALQESGIDAQVQPDKSLWPADAGQINPEITPAEAAQRLPEMRSEVTAADVKAAFDEAEQGLAEAAGVTAVSPADGASSGASSGGGWMDTDVATDLSTLKTSEIAGSYHVEGTFDNPVFGGIPIDDIWTIEAVSDTAVTVRWTGLGPGYSEGMATCEVSEAGAEYWSAGNGVGEITLAGAIAGRLEVRRTGSSGGDTVTFTGTLHDAAADSAQATYTLTATKR